MGNPSILTHMVDAEPAAQHLTRKGRATRDRIISCATELVLTGGFSALSIDNVRRAASVSGSQMTHYFADKDALIRAVISHQTQALLDFHRQPALRGLDTFEDFDLWAELTLRFGKRKNGAKAIPVYGALAGEIPKCDDETLELLADGYRQCVEVLSSGLQRLKDRGELVADADPEELACVLMSAHQGANLLAMAYQRPWPDPDALQFALRYLRMFATGRGDQSRRPSPNP